MKQLVFFFSLATGAFAQNVVPLAVSDIDSVLLMANFANTNNTIDISNVTITANDSTIGLFQGFNDYPVSDGIVLSTGGAEWAMAPSASLSGPYRSNIYQPNDHLESLLDSITPSGNGAIFYNSVSIEFDFVPHFDAINFEYVFASTEYTNYTCSQFNDVFGFFLSGPGITGGYYNSSSNLATVPGTNGIPVCINSINGGAPSGGSQEYYCEYVDSNYQNNSIYFNENDPANSNYVTFPFNGYTENLTIVDSLIPDSTYHLTIIISDVTDAILNSAVFLSANTFGSYPVDSNLWGCMDSTAINYNPDAIYDDGSCTYSNIHLDELNEVKNILSQIPNPINEGALYLSDLEEGMEVSIYNSIGRRVVVSTQKNIDISHLDQGIYIIEVNSGQVRTSSQFIKL